MSLVAAAVAASCCRIALLLQTAARKAFEWGDPSPGAYAKTRPRCPETPRPLLGGKSVHFARITEP